MCSAQPDIVGEGLGDGAVLRPVLVVEGTRREHVGREACRDGVALDGALTRRAEVHGLVVGGDRRVLGVMRRRRGEGARGQRRRVDAEELLAARGVQPLEVGLIVHGERTDELRAADGLWVELEGAGGALVRLGPDVNVARRDEEIMRLVVGLRARGGRRNGQRMRARRRARRKGGDGQVEGRGAPA